MAVTTALDREAFPLTPSGGRTPHSTEPPSAPQTRPWALRFARVPDSTGAVRIPAHAYDHSRQVNLSDGGGLLTCMANTHTPTVPDGSTENPPPLDEGPKD
ncbi:putative ATP-grasp-modified RiPP [Streptomyces sp. NPDC059868]|uniref:putative ATP-grasp-modified RiPP n=1 Tax=Streptomyces sp. NPDC059868 TaxID=3346979 RepID=UPI00365CC174